MFGGQRTNNTFEAPIEQAHTLQQPSTGSGSGAQTPAKASTKRLLDTLAPWGNGASVSALQERTVARP